MRADEAEAGYRRRLIVAAVFALPVLRSGCRTDASRFRIRRGSNLR